MCHFTLAKESLTTAYLIDFDEYFKTELKDLSEFEELGLSWSCTILQSMSRTKAGCSCAISRWCSTGTSGRIASGAVTPA